MASHDKTRMRMRKHGRQLPQGPALPRWRRRAAPRRFSTDRSSHAPGSVPSIPRGHQPHFPWRGGCRVRGTGESQCDFPWINAPARGSLPLPELLTSVWEGVNPTRERPGKKPRISQRPPDRCLEDPVQQPRSRTPTEGNWKISF